MPYTFVLASPFKQWWEDLVAWLQDFFDPNLEGFTNFDFGQGELLNIRIIIFGIFLGVLVAALYMVYIKNVIGAFVRKLLADSCLSRETAKTLSELGYSKNPFVRHALRGSVLRSTVTRIEGGEARDDANEDPKEKKKRQDENVRYYIEEEKKYAAEMRFRNGGSRWPTFFFVFLVSVICVFIIFGLLPQILRFLDSVISIYSREGNTLK